ncbi:ATP-binding protein [Tsukamurella tyrosinosolvens]|uniref:ATP/GTP-binding protein n=2 Tax=Tsukamurella tyrosinosolvens TaxID=57704 RepID=UPI000798D491|nr:ATP-binding protein [Tsukamurella tyrosinosolvens]KXP05819.1 ATP-binding protein [Tsukamurella tyrosinosolvens]MCA4993563.1 ATP-binding protein [Tsukamurella tyrosinosolvens]QRY83112.1 ATP-binding protein [Tsukamurella tyrosinosolvens]
MPDTPRDIKLAISGTYSTGKSTTTEALSIATGIQRTHALTSREILIDLVPGKTVMELNSFELIKLGLRRLEERIHNEANVGSFISDGSVIHEWVYGEARMRTGINPGADWKLRLIKKAVGINQRRFHQRYQDVYGDIVKDRAKRLYDGYVHLPVEFDMKEDGHRPVSEPFRRLSDELLIEAIEEIGVPYIVARGSVRERLDTIISHYNLPVVIPVEEAIATAKERVSSAIEVLEKDSRFHEAQRKKSPLRQLQWAIRY